MSSPFPSPVKRKRRVASGKENWEGWDLDLSSGVGEGTLT
jgi:hypothetical protein